MRVRITACLIAAAFLSCTQTAERTNPPRQQQQQQRLSSTPTGTFEPGVPLQFGFVDATGRRLLTLEFQEQPQALTQAACSGLEMLPIRFIGRKEAAQADTGRDTAANFDARGGFYYEIQKGKTTEDTTCLLTDNRFLSGKIPVHVIYGSDKPDKKVRDRIAQAKKRGVKEAWGLARTEPDSSFYMVLFERQGDNALFSIVMATPSRLVFLDFPGNYKNEDSVWRVDDGGEVDPLSFSISLVFDSSQGISFMYTWLGAEGDSIAFVHEAGDIFRPVKSAYRYMSPG